MSTYKIRRIEVDFPFEADDCQLVYMEKKKIIQSLHNVSPQIQKRCRFIATLNISAITIFSFW